jgi:hypothetical protein
VSDRCSCLTNSQKTATITEPAPPAGVYASEGAVTRKEPNVAAEELRIVNSTATLLGVPIPESDTSSDTETASAGPYSPGSVSDTHSHCVVCATIKNTAEAVGARPLPSDLLEKSKREIVNRLMAIIYEWLEDNYGPIEEPCDGEEGCAGHSRLSGSTTSGGSGQANPSLKRQYDGDERDGSRQEDEDGEGDGNGCGKGTVQKRQRTDRCNFACPYFKKDPVKFRNCRTCCGPGWHDFHRVK